MLGGLRQRSAGRSARVCGKKATAAGLGMQPAKVYVSALCTDVGGGHVVRSPGIYLDTSPPPRTPKKVVAVVVVVVAAVVVVGVVVVVAAVVVVVVVVVVVAASFGCPRWRRRHRRR